MEQRIALFPGSFDPITLGHQSLVARAVPLFDKIVVAIGTNTSKNYLFDEAKRLEMVKKTFADYPTVEVVTFTGLTVDFCTKIGAKYILRGLRNTIDFEYERSIADMNQALVPTVETVFIMTQPQHSAISSTIVREIIKSNGNAVQFLPKGII